MSELFECEVSMSRPQALAVVDALSVVSDAAWKKGAADPGAVQTFNDAFPDAEDRAETSETARFAMALFRAGVATIPETGTLFSRADTGPFSEVCAHARDDTSFGDDYALFFWADEDGSVDHGALFAPNATGPLRPSRFRICLERHRRRLRRRGCFLQARTAGRDSASRRMAEREIRCVRERACGRFLKRSHRAVIRNRIPAWLALGRQTGGADGTPARTRQRSCTRAAKLLCSPSTAPSQEPL